MLSFFLTGTVRKKCLVSTLPPRFPLCADLTPSLTLTGTEKSACHSLCCSHSSSCLTTATQMFAPNLKGDHGTVLLGLLVEAENEYFNLNHSQVQLLIWTPRDKRTNLGWLLVLDFLVCKQSLGCVSVVPQHSGSGWRISLLLMQSECVALEASLFPFVPLFFQVTEPAVTRFFDVEREAALLTLLWASEVEIPKGGFIKIKQIYNLRSCKAWFKNQLQTESHGLWEWQLYFIMCVKNLKDQSL